MKFPLPRPLFPRLLVTPADEDALVALVDEFIDKLLAEEHAFRVTNAGQVDTTKWKHLRQSEDTAVYRERSGSGGSAASMDPSDSKEPKDQKTHKLIPPFLVIGKVPGSLDDLLYGYTVPTRESSLIKISYVSDTIVDLEVLRSLRRPTLDEPFSHVTLKWFVLTSRSGITTTRDHVYIDAIGTREIDGERIGYRFSHSIPLKGAGPMTDRGIVRSNLSVSTIFREGANGVVNMYGRAFFAPGGAVPHSVFMYIVSQQVTSAAEHMLNGQYMKLALAVRRSVAGKWTVAVPPPQELAEDASKCGVCAKTLHALNKSRTECVLCARRMCQSCRVRKELSFLNDDFSVKRLRITYCGLCFQQAIRLPARFAAVEEFLSGQDDFYRAPEVLASPASGGAASSPASTMTTP